MKTLLKGTFVALIALGLFISNPFTMYCEGDSSSNMHSIIMEEEIVSLRTIFIPKGNASEEEKNSKKDTDSNSIKYLSLEEVKALTNPNMDLSKPSGLSKKDFVALIKKMKYDYTGMFMKSASYIWNLAQKYQFNEIFFMALMANESLWCSSELAIKNNNYTSQIEIIEKEEITEDGETKIVFIQKMRYYSSEKECFRETAKNLSRNYLKEGGDYYVGKTIYDINENYCEPGEHKDGTPYKYMWADDTYKCMEMILGK